MYLTYAVLFISIFFIGLAVGSFINLLVIRLPEKQSIIKRSSHCDYCGHELGLIELIPLFGYFILKGKCKHCKHMLPEFYPFIELATGVVFVLSLLRVTASIDMTSLSSIYIIFGAAVLIGLFLSIFVFFAAYDIMYMEVLDKYSIPLIISLFCINLVLFSYTFITKSEIYILGIIQFNPIYNFVAAFVAAGVIAFIVWATKGRGMGGGDIRIAAIIGLVAGFKGTLIALYLSFIIGALFGLGYGVYKGKLKGVKVPFVPFLSAGAILGFLFGVEIFKLFFPLY